MGNSDHWTLQWRGDRPVRFPAQLLLMAHRTARDWLSLVVRLALLALVLGFATYYLARQWNEVGAALSEMSPLYLGLSMLVVLAGLVVITLAWVTLLNGLGPRVPIAKGAQIALVGSLGKYVPGSLWAYVMQMELGRASGVVRSRVLIASLYAAGIGVVASLLLGSLSLPLLVSRPEVLWLFALLPPGLICLHPKILTAMASFILKLAKRPPLTHTVSGVTVAKAMGWTLLGYLLYGLHLWLLAGSMVTWDLTVLLLVTGAVSIGFTVSLLAFLLPSGVGVREAVLIAAMSLVMSQAQAAAVSLVSRLMFTAGDLMAAGAAALVAVALRPKGAERVAGPSGLDDAEGPEGTDARPLGA